MGSPTIFSGNYTKFLTKNAKFNDTNQTEIITDTGVPSASAPNGSLALSTNGKAYVRKAGAWVQIQDPSDVFAAIAAALVGYQPVGNYITSLTGNVTATGPGAASATIANGAVTSAKLNLTTLSTTGAATLGNSSSGQHQLRGAQAADYQVLVNNTLNATGASGLRVYITNSNAASIVQDWSVNGTVVGYVDGVGKWTLGDTSSGTHTLQGEQAGDFQVKIDNSNVTNGTGGLSVNTTNTDPTTIIQRWFSNGADRGFVNGVGKWTLGSVGGSQGHVIYGATAKLIRPNNNVNQGSTFEFANAAGTVQAYVGLGANTGTGLVVGEINNGLVLKSYTGMVFSGANNRVDGKMDSTGAWTLGSTSSNKHVIQGGQAADFQVGISNALNSASANGLSVSTASTSASTAIQAWYSGGVQKADIDGRGVLTCGPASPSNTFPGHRLVGVTDGSATAAGYVGEVREVTQATNANYAATATYKTAVSLGLPPGSWLVTGQVNTFNNGATVQSVYAAVVLDAANPPSDAVTGVNEFGAGPSSVTTNTSVTVSNILIDTSTSPTKTVYLKVLCVASAGTPQYRCRLVAVRIR